MPYGTARNKLSKIIMFNLIQYVEMDTCSRCGKKIITVDDLSVEHDEPWLHSENPVEKFFDLGNISFSHAKCNSSAARVNTEARKSTMKKHHGDREKIFKLRMAQLKEKLVNVNGELRLNTRSGFLGVELQPSGKYRAKVMLSPLTHGVPKQCNHSLGNYSNPKEAAKAFDSFLESKFGDLAITNKRLGIL